LVDGIKRVVERLGKLRIELCKERGSEDVGGNLEKKGRSDNFASKNALNINLLARHANMGANPYDRCPGGVQEQIVCGSVVKWQGIRSRLEHRQWIENEIRIEVVLRGTYGSYSVFSQPLVSPIQGCAMLLSAGRRVTGYGNAKFALTA
jgi:hypothetical protein